MIYLKSDYLNDILSYLARYYSEIMSCIRKPFSKIISQTISDPNISISLNCVRNT